MVLASGCGSKTLVRIGGGNLKSLVVFCVLALAAYATLRGITAVAARGHRGHRGRRRCRPARTCRRCWLTATRHAPRPLACAGRRAWGCALVAFALARAEGAQRASALLGGLGIGAVVVGGVVGVGRLGHLAEHP
jgi:hypothetical protein